MNKTPERGTILHAKVRAAMLCACLPAALALAGCNQPPAAAPPATVVEKMQLVVAPVSPEEQTRRDEERRSRQPQ